MNRRRINRYRRGRTNSGMKFIKFIGIIVLAVFLGYITARFIIAPLIGYDTDVLKFNAIGKSMPIISEDKNEDKNEDKIGNKSKGKTKEETESDNKDEYYVLQYGAFSSEDKAESICLSLKEKEIYTEVIKKDNVYKVVSKENKSKDAALKELKEIKEKVIGLELGDIFVTDGRK